MPFNLFILVNEFKNNSTDDNDDEKQGDRVDCRLWQRLYPRHQAYVASATDHWNNLWQWCRQFVYNLSDGYRKWCKCFTVNAWNNGWNKKIMPNCCQPIADWNAAKNLIDIMWEYCSVCCLVFIFFSPNTSNFWAKKYLCFDFHAISFYLSQIHL